MDENNNKKRANDDIEGEDLSGRAAKKPCGMGEHLICAITHELPFDPVMAEDGQIYERSAIQQHFRSNEDNPPIRSPMTNEPMGTRLISSPQIKQLIETMIENGSITGELKQGWEETVKKKKKVDDLLKKADQGNDAEAMYKVSLLHAHIPVEQYGLELNMDRSWSLMVAAHEKQYPPATAIVGMSQFMGNFNGSHDVQVDTAEGGMHLGLAAGLGSKYAMLLLGQLYAHAEYWDNEFPRSTEKAIQWLRRGLETDCMYNDVPETDITCCRKLLDDLTGESSTLNGENAQSN